MQMTDICVTRKADVDATSTVTVPFRVHQSGMPLRQLGGVNEAQSGRSTLLKKQKA